MKFTTSVALLSVAAVSSVSAIILPDETMTSQFALQKDAEYPPADWSAVPVVEQDDDELDRVLQALAKNIKCDKSKKKDKQNKQHHRDPLAALEELDFSAYENDGRTWSDALYDREAFFAETETENEIDQQEQAEEGGFFEKLSRWALGQKKTPHRPHGPPPPKKHRPIPKKPKHRGDNPHDGTPHRPPPSHGPPSHGPPPHGPPGHHGPPDHGDGKHPHGPPPHGPPPHGPPHHDEPHPPHGPPPHGPPPHGPPPHGPPPHGPPPPHHDKPPHPPQKPPHHGKPGKPGKPGKGPKHGKPKHPHHYWTSNHTIYELISKSNYTTKFAELISNYSDIVDILNSTKVNHTLFIPSNKAFAHLPKGHVPPKEFILKTLLHHIAPGHYPVHRLLLSNTIPTLLNECSLGNHTQRLRVGVGYKGVNLDFLTGVIPVNIVAKNGIIHGVDHFLVPPPPAFAGIQSLPSAFSQLQLGLVTTGLEKGLKNYTSHHGGTFFAPTNEAFRKLGPRINAFLFGPRGKNFLKALLEYHLVADATLYSDFFYPALNASASTDEVDADTHRFHHFKLTSVLGKPIFVDVRSVGRHTSITVNKFTRVSIADAIAKDGVVQVVSSVLLPPRKHCNHNGTEAGTPTNLEDSEVSIDLADFMARFDIAQESTMEDMVREELKKEGESAQEPIKNKKDL
jgi:uncharacterized surface protein with fasciclin (FAS1) repeats